MVTAHFQKFRRNDSGSAMSEALLVMPVMLLILAITVEFSAALMQWNKLVKASQVAGRLASVSSPLTDVSALDLTPAGRVMGDAMPADAVSVSCGYGTGQACSATPLARLHQGSDALCGTVTNGMIGVCDVAGFVPAENIRVTYSNGGLGYVGRAAGPIAIVTVSIHDIPFNFFMLDRLFSFFGGGQSDWVLPSFPVTFVGEDLSSCEGC